MSRAPGLDLLRALAIVWVMYSHGQLFGVVPLSDPVATAGWMGVDLFFALSGFLIGGQLLRAAATGQALRFRRFYLRRFLRTGPAFLVVVALYALFPGFHERQGLAPLWEFLTFTWNLKVDFLHQKAFSHVWSLCVEEQFYLVAPLAVWLLTRRPAVWKAVGALVLLVGLGVALRSYLWLHDVGPLIAARSHLAGVTFMEKIYYPTWTRLDGLLAGLTAAGIQAYRPALWAALTRRANVLLAVGLAGVCFSVWFFRDQRALAPSVVGYPLLAASSGLLVIAGASGRGLIGTRAIPGAGLVASLAYGLYLIHKQAYHLVMTALGHALDAQPWLAFGCCVLGAVAAGGLLYVAVERPGLKLRDLLDRRRLSPQPAADLEKIAA